MIVPEKLKRNDTKEVISCMGIVSCIKNNNIYVALLKDKNNCWVIPKGHLEKNESYVDATIREIKEETHIDINSNEFIGKVDEYKYYSDLENVEKLIKIYLFKINNLQKIVPLVEENFIDGKWVVLEEAIQKCTYQEQKNDLKKINVLLK